VSEGISLGSKAIDEAAPIKVEVLLLAFRFGMPAGAFADANAWRVCQQHAQTTTSQSPARNGSRQLCAPVYALAVCPCR